MSTSLLLGWILLPPLAGAVLIALIHLLLIPVRPPRALYTFIALAGTGISALAALAVGYESLVHAQTPALSLFNWLDAGMFSVSMSLSADALTSAMLLFVAPVGFLIHVYATGYMRDETDYARFFALFNLFMFFMLLLILADNPVMMFVGWEGVGFCSYALISFYFEDRANVKAGSKAFILNRIGDFGFLSALMLLFVAIGEHGFTFAAIEMHLHEIPAAQLNLIAALLFVGAMGKSAQIPLYVWLPDAMAGPTPVSALIHAATMVTAGVYMVARFSPLYSMTEEIGLFIGYVGAFSALLAALIATRQNDIKKILAYSTMSQLGYMFMAAGLGGYSFAIFHVFTHAFFKALLFMGAGALIIAMHHEQDITKMGGLKKQMPLLFGMMLVATLAISAIPPFAGFFSKDAIMAHLFASGNYPIYLMALFTSALTAYYMFRLLFFVFFGRQQHAVHSVPASMLWPMGILAIFSLGAGFFNLGEFFGGTAPFSAWLGLSDTRFAVSHSSEMLLMTGNTLLIAAAIALAYRRYGAPDALRRDRSESFVAKVIAAKFYVDELYDRLFVRPLYRLSDFFDEQINHNAIDRNIHKAASGYLRVGEMLKFFHNGNVRYYALYMSMGVSALMLYLYIVLEV